MPAGRATVWAISIDCDLGDCSSTRPPAYMLTSMLKKVDVATTNATARSAPSFTAGRRIFDLVDDGVDYSTSGDFVDDIADQLNEYKARIVDGAIEVRPLRDPT